MDEFLQRLRERKLVQRSLAYLAAAFALIQELQQVIALPFSGIVISPALLKLDPVWDPLRKDARFQKLIDDGNKPRGDEVLRPHISCLATSRPAAL